MQLQRDKEKFNIDDVHLGLHGESLNKMLQLLERAVQAVYHTRRIPLEKF